MVSTTARISATLTLLGIPPAPQAESPPHVIVFDTGSSCHMAMQAAFESALMAFAPGLGAGKLLNAAFARAWQADAAAAVQTVN